MIINDAAIDLAFRGFKAVYTDAYNTTPVAWDKIAMQVPSSARSESYGWLGQFPKMREWVDGERQLKQLEAHGFTIQNRKFESTVTVGRDDFEDDRLGVFKPLIAEMGHTARQHPEELVFGLLAKGFTETCYDGQHFFDAEHPIPDETGTVTGEDGRKIRLVSNMQEGTGAPWFLLDTSRSIKPLIWQARAPYDLQQVADKQQYNIFMTDTFVYGIRARVNAGFGLWQLSYGSKADLTAANYAAARAAMMSFTGDQQRILGVRPTVLVVPPSLEETALNLLNAATLDGGASNPWKGTAEIIVSPYLAA